MSALDPNAVALLDAVAIIGVAIGLIMLFANPLVALLQ